LLFALKNIPSHHRSTGASSEWYAGERIKKSAFAINAWAWRYINAKLLSKAFLIYLLTSSGIFSRVLINWTRVRIILHAELLEIMSNTNYISLIVSKHDKIYADLNYIFFYDQPHLLGTNFCSRITLEGPPVLFVSSAVDVHWNLLILRIGIAEGNCAVKQNWWILHKISR